MGNLVTNDWWGDAWLHEGMATYYQNDLYDVVENTWDRVSRLWPNADFLLGQRSEPRFASLLLYLFFGKSWKNIIADKLHFVHNYLSYKVDISGICNIIAATANIKKMYNICTTSAQQFRRWSSIVQHFNVIQMFLRLLGPPPWI